MQNTLHKSWLASETSLTKMAAARHGTAGTQIFGTARHGIIRHGSGSQESMYLPCLTQARPWVFMVGHGWPLQAMARQGQPRLAKAGQGHALVATVPLKDANQINN